MIPGAGDGAAHEEVEVFRGADRLHSEAGQGRDGGGLGLPVSPTASLVLAAPESPIMTLGAITGAVRKRTK